MSDRYFPKSISDKYEIYEWKHPCAILKSDFPTEWSDLLQLLENFSLHKSWIENAGGSKSELAIWVDEFMGKRGWVEKQFSTSVVIDNKKYNSPTHKVDCYKNRIALELEWNNKDPFFDRDLNNFRLLFDLRAISVGIIITRSDELQKIFNDLGKGKSYGNSTTHISKLIPKIDGGGGAGCPILVIGITSKLYKDHE